MRIDGVPSLDEEVCGLVVQWSYDWDLVLTFMHIIKKIKCFICLKI